MRVLKVEDVFKKKYSIRNSEIVESENGQYYTRQAAQYVLNNKNNEDEMQKFDEKQIKIDAVKYFRNKYANLLSSENRITNLLEQPIKRFEIFTLDTLGGKTFLVEAASLPDGKNRELYYDFDIANEIYQKMIDIKDSTCNDYEEVKYIYEREILQTESEISELKLKDNELFKEDIKAYNLISQTPLYENYLLLNKDKEHLIEENKNLNKIISEYNEKIRDLSKKLKVSLERVELLQKPKTFFEKLKDLFRSDKKQLLIGREKNH